MIALAVMLACLAHAAPLDAPLAELDRLVRAQDDLPADEIKALDGRIGALGKEFAGAGPAAAGPLGALAAAAGKPLKERVWAVNFLALIKDPAAYAPLSALALDRKQPDAVRGTAVSALEATGVSPAALRETACAALAQEDLPQDALRESALLASRTGCSEPRVLSRRAKAYGARPKGRPASYISSMMISALARSQPPAAARELWGLFDYYAPRTDERRLTLDALREQLENQKGFLNEARRRACEALSSEDRRPDNAVAALRLLQDLDARACAPALLRELGNADAEVVAQASETLAVFRVKEAAAPIKKILDGAIGDDRFGPKEGRPDPAALLDRLKQSYILLR